MRPFSQFGPKAKFYFVCFPLASPYTIYDIPYLALFCLVDLPYNKYLDCPRTNKIFSRVPLNNFSKNVIKLRSLSVALSQYAAMIFKNSCYKKLQNVAFQVRDLNLEPLVLVFNNSKDDVKQRILQYRFSKLSRFVLERAIGCKKK